ncbi:DUF4199 domain-containing protein [Sphingomicrobium clamense]|uniref:DUF4199 domain-containing protein n=1 Tax=Sphingomicrobium clamense TaxID=2851013 RepID=A0ABS6V976_9SPHN|nr:DUF4199 domain-containing protein [Sphingomicrobium sp. B8]MBW0145628.1 DUF4199 domain-containing protein [Sphingomicrobium sp. B8]
MQKTILTYGLLAGITIAVSMTLGGLAASGDGFMVPEWVGYLLMLVAMSFIFIGVKRYRDGELGGAIGFAPAFKLGLGIALVASLIYVASWELYLAQTDYSFAQDYIDGAIASLEASGASAADVAAKRAEMEGAMANYGNPLYRLPITFLEIFPVGLVVSLVTALILRNARAVPAHTE